MQFLRTSALAVGVLATTAGCATLFGDTTQRIEVTSTPPGAEVLLGEPVGTTPAEIRVSRRRREPQIRIEKDGRTHYAWLRREISLRRILPSIAAGVFLGYLGGITGGWPPIEERDGPSAAGGLAWGAAPVILDLVSGAAYAFPSRVTVDLAPPGARRLEVPERLRADLARSLAAGPLRAWAKVGMNCFRPPCRASPCADGWRTNSSCSSPD